MNTPRVDRLVLYKHGVALVGRSGPLDGDFELTLRRDDMKDVLKSLTVDIVDGQASVGAISFDSPADPREELAGRNLLLASGDALRGLLDALRGRVVEVRGPDDEPRRGEVIGVDDSGRDRRVLVLRTESGALSLVDLTTARGLELAEEPSRQDLDYLVEKSRAVTAGPNCQLRVQVRGSAELARVYYLVPAPMWRVSYRLVRDGDRLSLAAMGIVHNPLDEDLDDVELTLTTGQPVSFDIDLYQARQVRRTVVQERDRVADDIAMMGAPEAGAALSRSAPAGAAMAAYAEAALDVETADRGEHFEYRMAAPVSLARGSAAMVPLTIAEVEGARRELVWSDGADPAPQITLSFVNSTPVVLEEGPAVIYEDGGYAGEAMLGFTARGANIRLTFAKDLAARCSRDSTTRTVAARVQLAEEAVVEEQRRERLHTLRVDNDHDEPVTVVFEFYAHSEHRVSAVENAIELAPRDQHIRRFEVAAAAHTATAATVLETWSDYTHIEYRNLSHGRLEDWLAGRSLDAKTIGALAGVLDSWEQARRLNARGEQLRQERDEVFTAQTRISEQLEVLGTDGPEGELRARQVGELQRRNAQVAAIEAGIAEVRAESAAALRSATDALAALIG
ncbi:DUF4139 domain-containing protein [Mycolicibacterium brumae]|uniref:DUF4139 domain-containing protein n=1 Tax=Mycolicibacterium brumae TaxID=85968 RepID=A0A2G5PAE0_9MYCO|nr:DUF4139 domain-containing protein [Mycolicibacterium brumae]MCV7192935.1 hypothetical protein [Mycolicibacterium brumae]PIB75227.1 hypothetical protein CQY22_010210 [Mycolicibacterium brumae]RWA23524.1 hypothetical protein MBRU_01485 [Mycolicibacterium brumae DSM 44177]UWW08546.1 DUF4139 domain-containing protein [Mycolicibacterium brumae]